MGSIMQMLKKHSALISVNSRSITTTQKKALNMFYKTAKERLEAGQELSRWHEVDMRDLKAILGTSNQTNMKHLKEELKKLTTISVEYNILEKDKDVWGCFSLLTEVKIELNELRENRIYFKLGELIEKNLVLPNVFAKIDLKTIKDLKSKYSVIMYEILEDYKNVNIPKMTIKKFRELMGIEESQYKLTANLKKKVFEVIKTEINEKTNFTIDYELHKTGRKITGIQWQIIEFDESKQNRYFEKMSFIEAVRHNYKAGETIFDDRQNQGVCVIMGKNGLLAKKYDWRDKPETIKRDTAMKVWDFLFHNQNKLEKPNILFKF
jgi:plasmid replication initiation protein